MSLGGNTTKINELISKINNLPNAGSGGGGEMCTVTFVNNEDVDIDFIFSTATGWDWPYMGGNDTLSFETKKGSIFVLFAEFPFPVSSNYFAVEGVAEILVAHTGDGITLFVWYVDGNSTITLER